MLEYFKDKHIEIRFGEFMDVGNDNGWDFSKVVTKDEMLTMIEQHFEIDPCRTKIFWGSKNIIAIRIMSNLVWITSVSAIILFYIHAQGCHQMGSSMDVYLQ